MTIERAIVSGTIANAVNTRAMFTCDVVEVGGDTSPVLWGAYIGSIYDEVENILAPTVAVQQYEIQRWNGSQYVTTAIVPYTITPGGATTQLVNSVAAVLIGTALGVRKMGRKFFGGIDMAHVTGNTLGVAALSYMATAVLAYITPFIGLGGGSITPGIKDKANVFRPFVGGVVSAFLGTMRRRKPGVGI